MSGIEIVVVAAAAVLTGVPAWFFFGPKKSRQAALREGVQEVRVTVKGGYSPDVIEVASPSTGSFSPGRTTTTSPSSTSST